MVKEHLTDEQIALCAEALSKKNVNSLPNSLQQHLNQCDECANQVTLVSELSESITLEAESESKTRKIGLTYRISAAAVILVLIGLGFYKGKPLKQEQSIAQTTVDSILIEKSSSELKTNENVEIAHVENKSNNNSEIEEPKNPEIIQSETNSTELLAYASNADMEKLVERFNSGAMRGNDIKVLSPILVSGKTNEIILEWTNEEEQELIVEFFDNKGNKLNEQTTTQSRIQPKNLTNKGLYYWKLINEDFDLIFCGKIRVN